MAGSAVPGSPAVAAAALHIAVHRYSEGSPLTIEFLHEGSGGGNFAAPGLHADHTFESLVARLAALDTGMNEHPSRVVITCQGSRTASVTVGRTEQGVDVVDLSTSGFADDAWFRAHFWHILDGGATDGDKTVASLQSLPPALRDVVLLKWSGLPTDAAIEPGCLHRLVEAQARRSPDAPALVHTGVTSYAALNARANRLARWLAENAGIRPGDLVGIAMGRCEQLAITALAVLKTGAGYVPLEVTQPAARLRHIVDDLDVPLVLTTPDWAHAAADAAWDRLVLLDEEDPAVLAKDEADLTVSDNPYAVACVIYTSGTTGRPKGVLLTHQGLTNSMRWERDAYGIVPDDRLMFLASFSFSLAIVELFSPLCAGAQVVIAPQDLPRDGASIAALVAEHGVSLLSVVPSELKLLLDEPTMRWDGLRSVITGADVLPRPVVDLYFATCPSVPLFNIYGQTESSVDGTCWVCTSDDVARVPVGRPITNTTMYILDERMDPVPIGVAGELYTGGLALAHGYAGHPRLTAEHFVPHPFSASPAGARLYRSGDRARWLPGGVIELLGRDDHQVQIHGVRIELEEIEAILRTHPGVREAVVTVTESSPDWATLISGVPPEILDDLITEAESAR